MIVMEHIVADSAVFIMGKDINSKSLITVPSVIDELKSSQANMRFQLAAEEGARVESPDPGLVREVLKVARYSNDIEELSQTDVDILAKALEYKDSSVLFSDDYAVQNVAVLLKINVKPVSQKKIGDVLVWGKKCTGCKKRFDRGDICPVCGSALKKVRKRKI